MSFITKIHIDARRFGPLSLARHALLAVMVAFFSFVPAKAFSGAINDKAPLRSLSIDESRVIIERLRNMRKEMTSLQAGFIEERSIPSLAMPLKFEGRVYYKKDTLFFMEYEKPVHHILRVKADEALFFVEGSRTADLVDLSSVQGIAGNGDIFNIDPARFSGQVLEGEQAYVMEVNRENSGENDRGPRISVYLNKNNLSVKKIIIADESGDMTMITLFDVKVSQDLPQSIRTFELPEDVKINRLNRP